jgi:hypothetical protein
MEYGVSKGADRWVDEQLFEEDVRAVLMLMRPNRRERLLGWREYRTGGIDFRVTVSWSPELEEEQGGEMEVWRVPKMAQVLESLLVGSVRNQDDLLPQEEFAFYRKVAEELRRRVDELEGCYT